VTLPKDDLYALKGAPVAAPVSLDAFRAADVPPGQLGAVKEVAAIDPLAFLTGKVTLNFADGPAAASPSKLANLTPFIDRERQVVRSATGQLAWNWGEGRMVVNAPQAQGVTGYLSRAGRVSLPDVAVESPLEYGSVLVVALDGKPLKTSQRMLLQVMSEDRNYGWKVAQAGGPGESTIQSIGSAPLLVKDLTGTVSLTRPDAGTLKVTPLDLSGYPAGAASTGARSIALKRDVLYYLISK
jgi:hypothetical protein